MKTIEDHIRECAHFQAWIDLFDPKVVARILAREEKPARKPTDDERLPHSDSLSVVHKKDKL